MMGGVEATRRDTIIPHRGFEHQQIQSSVRTSHLKSPQSLHSQFSSAPLSAHVLILLLFSPTFMSSLLQKPSHYTSVHHFSFPHLPLPTLPPYLSLSLSVKYEVISQPKKLLVLRSRQLSFMHESTRWDVLYFSLNYVLVCCRGAIIDEHFSHRGTSALQMLLNMILRLVKGDIPEFGVFLGHPWKPQV